MLQTLTKSLDLYKMLLSPFINNWIKLRFSFVVFLSFFSSFLDFISIGAIVPLMALILEPESLKVEFYGFSVAGLFDFFEISTDHLFLTLCLIFISLITISNGLKILLLWQTISLVNLLGSLLAKNVFKGFLNKEFIEYLKINSSEILSALTQKTHMCVNQFIRPCCEAFSAILSLVVIIIALLLINPLLTIAIVLSLATFFVVFFLISRAILVRNSQKVSKYDKQRIQVVKEASDGIRGIILKQMQTYLVNLFFRYDRSFRIVLTSNTVLTSLARLTVEPVVLTAILGYALLHQYYLFPNQTFDNLLPQLAAFLVGAARMLPSFQKISSFAQGTASISAGVKELVVLSSYKQSVSHNLEAKDVKEIDIKQVVIQNVRYRYSLLGPWVLTGLSIKINKGEKICIVGGSGAGKSTFLDILTGLLHPTTGNVLVNGKMLSKLSSQINYQKKISYVGQPAHLIDGTIEENICYGLPSTSNQFLELISEVSLVSEFMSTQLGGLNYRIGEDGARLSGGQRQRVLIARALFDKPNILVLDEATAALDLKTERKLINNLIKEFPDLTVISVTHGQKSTDCYDTVYEIKNGKISRLDR